MNKPMIIAFALALAPLAAQEPRMAPPVGQGPQDRKPLSLAQRMDRMAEHLNLNADQKTRIKALHEKHEAALKSRREAHRDARKAFHKAAENLETPMDQLRKLHEEMSGKAFEVLAEGHTLRLESRQILTPAQREKAAEMHGRIRERMKQRRDHPRRMEEPKP